MGQTPTPLSARGASSPDPSNPQQKPRLRDRYFAGWVVAAVIVPIPILASLITLLIYASLHPVIALPAHPELEWLGVGWVVILFGMLITVIIWALLAFPCGYFATPDGGNSRSSSKLRNRYDVLKTRFDRIKNTIPRTSTTISAPGSTPPADDDFMKQTALDEVECTFKYIDDRWTRNGMTWVVSSGLCSGFWIFAESGHWCAQTAIRFDQKPDRQ